MPIKTISVLSIGIFSLLLLTACDPVPPMQFGMQQSQFQQLTKDQQDQVIAAYNQRQQTDANNAVFNNAINSATDLIALKQKPATTAVVTPAQTAVLPTMPAMPPMPPMPTFPANSSGYTQITETSHTSTNSVQASLGV